jgi:hypothetical protein
MFEVALQTGLGLVGPVGGLACDTTAHFARLHLLSYLDGLRRSVLYAIN